MAPRQQAPTAVSEFALYGDGDTDEGAVEEAGEYEIDPLSDESLAALRRLAKYRPPKDTYPFPARRAAVMVALFGSRSGEDLNVILSTRSMNLRTFPGQVALPGGKVDDGDINIEAAARREAYEEIGLPENTEAVRYLTSLPPFLSRSQLLVTPVICFILDSSLKPEINPSEVDKVFSFPLAGFLKHRVDGPSMAKRVPPDVVTGERPFHTHHDYSWFEGQLHRFHSFEISPVAVTGLTAEILVNCAEIAYGKSADFAAMAPGQLDSTQLISRTLADPEQVRVQMEGTPIKGKL